MRVSIVHRLSFLCISAAALTTSANASASNPRAIVNQFFVPTADASWAAGLEMMISDLESDCNNFVNHSMWYCLHGDGTTWVEVGFTNGFTNGPPSSCVFSQAYWADNRPGNDYAEHMSGIGLTTWDTYQVQVNEEPCCEGYWDVWLNDITAGTGWQGLGYSVQYAGTGTNDRALQSGIEVLNPEDSAAIGHGWIWNWYRGDSTGAYQWGWPWDPNNPFYQDKPPFIEWYTPAGCGQCETEEENNASFSF